MLAGLRAQSPYSSPLQTNKAHHGHVADFLRNHDIILIDEEPSDESPSMSISLVNSVALRRIPDSYHFLTECWINPPKLSTYSFHAWCGAIDMRIASAIRDGQISAMSLRDWWTPHDIRFGACLGYPWSAITAFVQVEAGLRSRQSIKYLRVRGATAGEADVGFMAETDSSAAGEAEETIRLWRYVVDEVSAGARQNYKRSG